MGRASVLVGCKEELIRMAGVGMNLVLSSTDNKWTGGLIPREIVIHYWNDPAKKPTLDGVIAWFQNPASSVSAHYIASDNTAVRMMEETDKAWHALQANHYAIGIEIDPNYPGTTYRTVGEVVAGVRSRWGNLPLRKHCDVPGASTNCPGGTDIEIIEHFAQGGSMGNLIRDIQEARDLHYGLYHRYPDDNGLVFPWIGKEYIDIVRDAIKKGVEFKQIDDRLRVFVQLQQAAERTNQMQKQIEELKKNPANKELIDALEARIKTLSDQLNEASNKLKSTESAQRAAEETGKNFIQWIGQLFKRG